MISSDINTTKDKYDFLNKNSEDEVLADIFTITKSKDTLINFFKQQYFYMYWNKNKGRTKKATGHCRYNLLGFLLDNNFQTFGQHFSLFDFQ